MRRSIVTAALLFLAAGTAFGGPAAPETSEIRQPDGTTFKAKHRGDEYQHWLESSDTGHTVVRNPKSGTWEYAEQAPDGGVQSTNIKVVPGGGNAPSFIPRSVKPKRDTEREKEHLQRMNKLYQQRLRQSGKAPTVQNALGTATTASAGTAPSSGWTISPVTGTKKLLIVLVNFSDRTLVTTPQQWYDAVFSTVAGAKSVANYYKDNSFGKLSIAAVPHTQGGKPAGVVVVNLAMPHEYNGTAEKTWVSAALNQADQYVHFSAFDSDGDRLLERDEALVYFVVAGYEQSGSSRIPSVWAHAASYSSGGLAAAGVYFPVWARSGELNDSSVRHGIGVITHELGHQLAGLPDLYDTAQKNAGLGAFSLMAAGSWGAAPGESAGSTPVALDAWSREFTGWTAPVAPTANTTVTLGLPLASPTNTLKVANPTLSTSEYFLVENRRPQGWDLGMTNLLGGTWSGGLLVQHVDNAMGTNQSGATPHQGVVVAQAAKPCDMLASPSCYGRQQTLFYSGNNTSLNATSTPSSAFYAGPSYRFLNSISLPGSSMTVAYSQPAATVAGTVTISAGAQYTKSLAVTLALSATAPAPATVTQMSFSNDGVNWSAWEPYAAAKGWTLAAGADGTRTVTARFRDSSGNVSATAKDTITLDSSAPMAALTLANVSNGGTTRNTSVSFTVGNAGVSAYRYKLDSGAWSANVAAGAVTTLSGLANGAHTLSAIAGDAAGNWQSTASPTVAKWTVDTIPPTTTATPPGGSYSVAQKVALTANESAAIYYTTNGTTPTTASSRYSTAISIPGSMTLKYFAVDAAGNAEGVKTSSYVIAGSTVPTGTGTTTQTVTNSYTFTVSGYNIVAYKYSLDGGALSAETPLSQKIVLYNLTPGAHKLSVYAKSSSGVWSTVPTTLTWTVR